ncbi:MAG: aminotransferase class V-fold PLP-dependent enzyme [Gemmatimonadaceae bacterium]|nr:aminotransferase class V-fold PLP-dependent enzyme [Gemmatimonadaceae bacterium]
MTDDTASRRAFLASLGAVSLGGLTPRALRALSSPADRAPQPALGLAAGGDFSFAPGITYLQTGSLGPTPRPVIEKVIAAWRELETDPAAFGYGAHEQAMEGVRAKAAAFIGCTTDELVLTNCTTEGMNWVAQGLTFAAGDRVLTTDQEHPGGRVCWDYVARRYGVVLDVVSIPPGENNAPAIVDRFAQHITPRTRVLSFSHLLTSTGFRMPVAELSALAHARGCMTVVDGAQAVGGIDVNVKALGCDVYATSGHKWLLAPKGTGLLYLSATLGKTIDPIALESGRNAYSASSGVCSLPSVLGLGATFDYHVAIGKSRIESYILALRDRLHAALQQVPKIRVVSAAPGPLTSPLLTYELPPAVDSGAFRQRLIDKYHIEVKAVPANFLNGHRISTHLFNTQRDVETLVTALKAELG